MVTTPSDLAGLADRGRAARPRAADRDDRRPRHPARRHRGRPGPGARADHPDVLRLPGDGDDQRPTSSTRSTTAGYQHVDVEFVLSPAWTTDWMTDEARAKLTAYGVAPPAAHVGDGPVPLAAVRGAARSAAASTPASPAASAPPPASRCGCAARAASPSTTSRRSDARCHPGRVPPPAGRGPRRADRGRARRHLRGARRAARRLRLRARPAPLDPRRRRRAPQLLAVHAAVLGRAADRRQAAARRRLQRGRARRGCASATRSR